jgi:hypothetical protein
MVGVASDQAKWVRDGDGKTRFRPAIQLVGASIRKWPSVLLEVSAALLLAVH